MSIERTLIQNRLRQANANALNATLDEQRWHTALEFVQKAHGELRHLSSLQPDPCTVNALATAEKLLRADLESARRRTKAANDIADRVADELHARECRRPSIVDVER